MPTSYQTVPLAVPPKTLAIPPEEPAPISVPTMKKLVAAAMVGTALVGGYSYGSSTNPAMINNVNGFAAGVSYLETPEERCKSWPGSGYNMYYLPDVVPANVPWLPPLNGNPATVCYEACLNFDQVAKSDPYLKKHGRQGVCADDGYTVFVTNDPDEGLPIFKKPFVCRPNTNSDPKVPDSDCAACAPPTNQDYYPCGFNDTKGRPLCVGAACGHK